MLVLFPRIIAVGISMRTLIGRNEASRTLAALRNLHLPERLIMIVAVIFRFFPVLSGDMKLLRQSIRTRGVFTIAASEAASAVILYRNTDRADGFARYPHRRDAVCLRRNTGHRLNPPQKQLSVASVFCVGCCVLRPAGSIDRRRPYPVIAVSATFNHISFKKESLP